MRITIDNIVCDIEINTIANWTKIREYIAIRKIRVKEREKKIIDLILNGERKLIEKLLKKTNKELKEKLKKLNKHRINLDRQGRFWSKTPFEVE